MPIIRIPDTDTGDKLGLEFNNGDYIALKKVVSQWGFKDAESALRFGIAVLLKAETKEVHVENLNGEKISIQPTDSLLRKHNDDEETAAIS